jgi:hypothetical protein
MNKGIEAVEAHMLNTSYPSCVCGDANHAPNIMKPVHERPLDYSLYAVARDFTCKVLPTSEMGTNDNDK